MAQPPVMPMRIDRTVRNGKKKTAATMFGQDEIRSGIDAHDFERVDLLGDAHGADFGSDARPDLTGQNQRHDRGGELQNHGFARSVTDQRPRDEGRFEVDAHLKRDDRTDEDRDDGRQTDGIDAQGLHFVDDAPPVDGNLLRAGKNLAHQHEITAYGGEKSEHGYSSLVSSKST